MVAAIALVATGGCAVSTGRVKTEVTVPTEFSGKGGQALPERWWLAFNDPTLTQLIDRGLEGNPGLLATWARLDAARASARASGASFYPSVDGSAGGGAGVNDDGTNTSLSVGLSASYEVDLWGRVAATHDAAVLEAQAGELDLRAAAISLSAEIASTWYQLVTRHAEHELLRRQLDLAERSLDLTRQRYEHGLIAKVDVLSQEQNAESIRGSLVESEQSTVILEHQLAVLLGRPPTEQAAPRTATLTALTPLPATGVPSQLLERRPDVAASLLRVRSADRSVAVAIANRYPRLSLGASLSAGGADPAGVIEGWAASLVANLVAPIFDGGQRAAEVDRSRAQLAAQVQGYAGAVLGALQEVEDALTREDRGRATLTSTARQLELASEVLTQVEAAYGAGRSDYLKVLDAMRSVQALERQKLEAESGLLLNRVALCRALAGSWRLERPKTVER